jgi:hypothetical protein
MKSRTIVIEENGGPEKLKLVEMDVGEPGPAKSESGMAPAV